MERFKIVSTVIGSIIYFFIFLQRSRALLDDDFLLVADTKVNIFVGVVASDVYQVSLHNGSATSVFPGQAPTRNPTSVAFDETRKHIYWTDVSLKTINRMSMATQTTSVVYADVQSNIDGMALDPDRQKIYYTDAREDPEVGSVCEVSMDGNNHRVITTSVGSKPRAIHIDKNQRVLYWTDWDATRPAIFSSPLQDITKMKRIIETGLRWPNAMAIDFEKRVMYWGDAGLHRIEMANLDGTGRVLIASEVSTKARYYAMTLGPEYVYFTDWTASSVRKLNRRTNELSLHFSQSFYHPYGIWYYSSGNRSSTSNFENSMSSSSASSSTMTTTTTPAVETADKTSTQRPTTTNDVSGLEPSGFRVMDGLNHTSLIILAVVVVGGIILVVLIITVGVVCSKSRNRNSMINNDSQARHLQVSYKPPHSPVAPTMSGCDPSRPPSYQQIDEYYSKENDYCDLREVSNLYMESPEDGYLKPQTRI